MRHIRWRNANASLNVTFGQIKSQTNVTFGSLIKFAWREVTLDTDLHTDFCPLFTPKGHFYTSPAWVKLTADWSWDDFSLLWQTPTSLLRTKHIALFLITSTVFELIWQSHQNPSALWLIGELKSVYTQRKKILKMSKYMRAALTPSRQIFKWRRQTMKCYLVCKLTSL